MVSDWLCSPIGAPLLFTKSVDLFSPIYRTTEISGPREFYYQRLSPQETLTIRNSHHKNPHFLTSNCPTEIPESPSGLSPPPPK